MSSEFAPTGDAEAGGEEVPMQAPAAPAAPEEPAAAAQPPPQAPEPPEPRREPPEARQREEARGSVKQRRECVKFESHWCASLGGGLSL